MSASRKASEVVGALRKRREDICTAPAMFYKGDVIEVASGIIRLTSKIFSGQHSTKYGVILITTYYESMFI